MAETDPQAPEEPAFRVEDRRHWARNAEKDGGSGEEEEASTTTFPTVVDEYRSRAEAAEKKLFDYIAAFKHSQTEHEQFRERLQRDVERRVHLQFGALVTDLLDCIDHLDLALAHARNVRDAAPLVQGVALTRDRFVAALERQGVERLDLDGQDFDPNFAEAVRVDPVAEPGQNGRVTETLRPGYKLGERVLRPAQVAVGRHEG